MNETEMEHARTEAAWLRGRLAEAWDEGYEAGCADGQSGSQTFTPYRQNPYRSKS
jgi:ribosome modulation factor